MLIIMVFFLLQVLYKLRFKIYGPLNVHVTVPRFFILRKV